MSRELTSLSLFRSLGLSCSGRSGSGQPAATKKVVCLPQSRFLLPVQLRSSYDQRRFPKDGRARDRYPSQNILQQSSAAAAAARGNQKARPRWCTFAGLASRVWRRLPSARPPPRLHSFAFPFNNVRLTILASIIFI